MARSDRPLALEGRFWRRLARWGASRGPEWFVRVSPPIVGLVACGVAAAPRRAVLRNLRRVRGRRGPLRDAVDLWEKSELAEAAFGAEVKAHYANYGRVELAAYDAAVTDWELRRGFERL